MFVCVCVCVCTRMHSVAQLCLSFCDPMDYSSWIFQAKILEWVTISSSSRSSLPRDPNCISCITLHWQGDSLPLSHWGNPVCNWVFFSFRASPVVQLVKSLPECGRPGFDPWVGKIPWRRERLPTPVFWPGEFHRLYSPWNRKELDRTERLSLSLSFS